MLESVHQLSHSHQAQDLSDQPKSKNKTKRIELYVVIKFCIMHCVKIAFICTLLELLTRNGSTGLLGYLLLSNL